MVEEYAVIDLFAGPGGLAEGFSSIVHDGKRAFSIVLSVEKEETAHKTLLLRSFLRQFDGHFPEEYYDFLNSRSAEPDWESLYPDQWSVATHEALKLELGTSEAKTAIDARLDKLCEQHGKNVILIGGPPCQAYSLVGRARNKGKLGYTPGGDPRHFLYREYIRILDRVRPAAFVMENVKGMLSSKVDGEMMFEKVLHDLRQIGNPDQKYSFITLQAPKSVPSETTPLIPSDFIVRAEDFGLPQARHRVIVIGIRGDIAEFVEQELLTKGLLGQKSRPITVRQVIGSMPKLRSAISRTEDKEEHWREAVLQAGKLVANCSASLPKTIKKAFRERLAGTIKDISSQSRSLKRTGGAIRPFSKLFSPDLAAWLQDSNLSQFANHETRGHMVSDLARYLFASIYAEVTSSSPKATQFPQSLWPSHKNWTSGKFADRFRVQLWDSPSTTVTSHISKDGHYFIHPDPAQCRSLTVREAARLQTFPDNYFFKGNRTQQYVQVGNAVPPFLAMRIAESLHALLVKAKTTAEAIGKEINDKNLGSDTDPMPPQNQPNETVPILEL